MTSYRLFYFFWFYNQILGPGMSTKMWEATIEHAQTCVLDKKIYVYKPHDLEQKSGVVFNVVGRVMGLLSDYQYVPIDKLSESEKALISCHL